jgi:hypothetical protein
VRSPLPLQPSAALVPARKTPIVDLSHG